MIAYLKGKLVYKDRTQVIIDVNGIGYECKISLQTYDALHEGEEQIKLFTHLQIKEDAHTLVGFYEVTEKKMFLDLISVSGVGLSTALVMLSSFSAEEIRAAIANENVGMIQSIKGIGSKTAQRIVLELKDKTKKESLLSSSEIGNNSSYLVKQEALKALITLGIPKSTAEKSIESILKSNPNSSIEELIKLALR